MISAEYEGIKIHSCSEKIKEIHIIFIEIKNY